MAESDGHTQGPAEADVTRNVDVYKVAGYVFVAPGVQVGYAITPNMAINVDFQAMLMFPSGGMVPVLHPALNFTYGL
jgi:hypothetical protein